MHVQIPPDMVTVQGNLRKSIQAHLSGSTD